MLPFLKRTYACFAFSRSSNSPNTVGPLPLIIAFTAPQFFMQSLIYSITGYAGIVTVSSTFPIFSAIA